MTDVLTREEAYEANVIAGWEAFAYGATANNGNGKFRSAGSGNGSRVWGLSEPGLPMGATGYVRIDTTPASCTNSDNTIAQDSCPLVVGEVYTIGAFVRGRGRFNCMPTQDGYAVVCDEYVDHEAWRFYCGEFTAKSASQNIYWRNMGVATDDHAGALEIAAPLLVRGGVASLVIARDQVTLSVAVDVASVDTWYRLQASTSAAPAKPTAASPSGWATTEPAYDGTATNTLYTCAKTTLTDGTFYWSAVSKSTAYEAAKAAWNRADAALSDSMEYVVGTQTAATGSWTGVTRDTALRAGKKIAYKLPYAGSGNASLQLKDSAGNNVGGNVAVYSMTTRVTTHYPAGSVIQMTYDGTYWRTSGWYDTNQVDRIQHNNACMAASANAAGKSYAVVAGTLIGYVAELHGYQTVLAGTVVDLSRPLLWATGNVAAGATFTSGYEVYPSQSLRNQASGWTGTPYEMAYLYGTLSGNSLTVADGVFTSAAPTEEDGMAYVPVGTLYSAYQVSFRSSSELWAFVGGAFQRMDSGLEVVSRQTTARIDKQDASIALKAETAVTDAQGELLASLEASLTVLEGRVQALVEGLMSSTTFTQTDDGFSWSIDGLLDGLRADLNGEVEARGRRMDFDEHGLSIGVKGDSGAFVGVRTVVDEDSLDFVTEDGEVLATLAADRGLDAPAVSSRQVTVGGKYRFVALDDTGATLALVYAE